MPYRTSVDKVGGIIDVDACDDLTPFITAANILVTKVCLDPELEYYSVSDEDDVNQLAVIETWLAAHFYAVFRLRTKSEQVGPVIESYWGKVDLWLNVTMYGQQAMLLDTSGALADLNNGIDPDAITGQVEALWLGTPKE